MGSLSVPFHFTSTFLLVVAAAGAVWVGLSRPSSSPRRVFRPVFFAGWVLVLAAVAGHGLYATSDASGTPASSVRAAGLVLVALSIAFGIRGVEASGRLFFAFLPAGLAEVVLAMVPNASRVGSGAWIGAHALQLVAAIAFLVWLWRAFSASIHVRFVAAFVVMLLIVVLAISGAITQVFAANIRTAALREARREGELQFRRLEDQSREALRVSRLIASLPDTRKGLADLDQAALAARAAAIEKPGGFFETLDFAAFLDSTGQILAFSALGRSGQGPNLDDAEIVSLAGTAVARSALQGIEAGSVEVIGANKIGVIGGSPILNPPGKNPPGAPISQAGVVIVGQLVDREYLLTLKGNSNREFSIVRRDGVVATSLESAGELTQADLGNLFEGGEPVETEGRIQSGRFFNSYVPMKRGDNEVVAALVVSRPSDVISLTQRNVGTVLFAIALAAALVALILAWLFGARITRPILSLTSAARRVREGDLESRVEVASVDEVGQLGDAFNEMTGSISRLTGDLRRAAEEEFEVRSRLETILQSMTDGVIAIDEDARVLTLNREAERITGHQQVRVVGRPITEVLQVQDLSGNRVSLPLYALERGSTSGVFVLGGRNGTSVPVAITSGPIRDEEGSCIGAVGVVRDLTPEREVERMKTEFLSNISHELRTPITPIKGYAEILKRRNLPRNQSIRFIENILESTRRLERIVDMLVDVSSIEAGRLVPRTAPVSLDKITSDIVERWKVEARKHLFERRGFRKLPLLNIDERLFPRAIDELIDNAVKFAPKGGKISLTAAVEKSGNVSLVRITVSDNGIGIGDDKMQEIFADFVQVDASATRQFGGLGLGLGYVRRIVEAHGGKLDASSIPGEGSRFSVLLPVSPHSPQMRARSDGKARGRTGKEGANSRKETARPISKKRGS